MKRENWFRIETLLEDIVTELDIFTEAIPAKYKTNADSCTRSIRQLVDCIYGVCENDYCDSRDIELTGYDEMLEMLPDGSSLSLDDMQRLISHIEQWKRGQ